MGTPLLVCHVVFRLDYGGLENGLVNLINHLPAERFAHAVVSLKPATTGFRDRIARPGVPVIDIGKREGKDLPAYARVWRVLRDLRPDIVHTRNIGTLDMLAAARLAGVRRFVHGEHGLDVVELDGGHRRYNRLRRLSRLLVDRYVAVSGDLSRWLSGGIGLPEERVSLIHNGVDTAVFHPGPRACALPEGFAPPGAFVIGTAGRLEPVKDQLTLARAFVRLLEMRPELRARARLVIVGDGSLRPEIERVLAEAGAAGLAWLPGFRGGMPDLYRALDLFVLPSRREGVSNTLLEAMASGLPAIATRVGGNPEVLEDGVCGRLVPPGEPEALAFALLRCVDDPAAARRQGEAARRRVVERFSLTAMVESYRRLYEDMATPPEGMSGRFQRGHHSEPAATPSGRWRERGAFD